MQIVRCKLLDIYCVMLFGVFILRSNRKVLREFVENGCALWYFKLNRSMLRDEIYMMIKILLIGEMKAAKRVKGDNYNDRKCYRICQKNVL